MHGELTQNIILQTKHAADANEKITLNGIRCRLPDKHFGKN